ncbi:MAG: hypothetical protein H7Y38_02685 [Armatimonadetes bacterium]|nr:hypothetical protein [Armatimonadota bacterium]
MSVITYQAVVEAGQIRLPAGVFLKDQTTVYVVVPPVTVDTRTEAECIEDAYADYPDAGEKAMMASMRQRMARNLREYEAEDGDE